MSAPPLSIGDTVIDGPTGMPAVIQDIYDGKVWLRGPDGGLEWTRHQRDVHPADLPEAAQ